MALSTFLDLQAAVMSDRFDEDQRGDVKNWLNSAYWQLWSLENWTFVQAKLDNATVTAGVATLGGVPSDLNTVRSLIRGDGTPIHQTPVLELEDRYYDPRSPVTGLPERYAVLNGTILLGPIPNETASDYQLVYDREYTPLVNDTDVPAVPAGAEMALVFKASATGLKLQNDFTWQFHEQDYQEQLDALRRNYLEVATERRWQTPAYRPGYGAL
jgi:hypothetical protein